LLFRRKEKGNDFDEESLPFFVKGNRFFKPFLKGF